MKRNFTPKFNDYLKSKMQPKESTLNFIKAFAASYQMPKELDKKMNYPGLILN